MKSKLENALGSAIFLCHRNQTILLAGIIDNNSSIEKEVNKITSQYPYLFFDNRTISRAVAECPGFEWTTHLEFLIECITGKAATVEDVARDGYIIRVNQFSAKDKKKIRQLIQSLELSDKAFLEQDLRPRQKNI